MLERNAFQGLHLPLTMSYQYILIFPCKGFMRKMSKVNGSKGGTKPGFNPAFAPVCRAVACRTRPLARGRRGSDKLAEAWVYVSQPTP